MGITGLLPFIEKASRRVNVGEFNGCTVAIDSYCWLHKGAFACADKLVRGEETDVHIKYCLKYVNMLLSKNVKPILVFDGRHLPAKALTETKRRESRNTSKKRAAELLKLGKIEEARSFMRRSVDITHEMALQLIKECRKRNIDCIVAPYEADAQLAYLNIRNIAHVVITEDSDLILFGCTKVLFKMDLEGFGTLVETEKLPLVMKCPIEHYTFDKFRLMCIMSGCDYLASLPGIGLAKARQFVNATQDSNFANALRKLPGFFNRSNLQVTDEYRENFLKAEATFKHQYVYDPIDRQMVRLTEPDSDDVEEALCVNAGELLDPKVAFQLALGNLDPFTLRTMDDWHPDHRTENTNKKIKTERWKDTTISSHPTIWNSAFKQHLNDASPWTKKVEKLIPMFGARSQPRKVVNLVAKYVPETQDDSLSIETLSNMYCLEPSNKRQKTDEIQPPDSTKNLTKKPTKSPSPILENKERCFKKILKNGSYSVLKRLSKFPRTVIGENVVESKFFSTDSSKTIITIQDSPKKTIKTEIDSGIDTQLTEYESQENSQKENSPLNSPVKKSRPIEEDSPGEINSPAKKNISEVNGYGTERRNHTIQHNSPTEINTLYNQNSTDLIRNTDTNSTVKRNSLVEANSPDKINSPAKKNSPILEPSPKSRNPFRRIDYSSENKITVDCLSQESVIENTEIFETQSDLQERLPSIKPTPPSFFRRSPSFSSSQPLSGQSKLNLNVKRTTCKVPGLKRTNSLPSNQPTLLSKFGFQKKPILKR